MVSYYQTRRHKYFDLLSSALSSRSHIFINYWNSSSSVAANWLGRRDQIVDLRFDHRNHYRLFRKTQVTVEDLNLKKDHQNRKQESAIFTCLLQIFKCKRNDCINHGHDKDSPGRFIAVAIDIDSK